MKKGDFTKAEALRQAQMALITNNYNAVGGERGGIEATGDSTSPGQVPSTTRQKLKVSQCGGRVPRHKATGVRGANPKDSLVRVKRQKKEGRFYELFNHFKW